MLIIEPSELTWTLSVEQRQKANIKQETAQPGNKLGIQKGGIQSLNSNHDDASTTVGVEGKIYNKL